MITLKSKAHNFADDTYLIIQRCVESLLGYISYIESFRQLYDLSVKIEEEKIVSTLEKSSKLKLKFANNCLLKGRITLHCFALILTTNSRSYTLILKKNI